MATKSKSSITPRAMKLEPSAEYVGMSPRKLAQLTHEGEIPVIKVSARMHLYDIADLNAFLDSRKVGAL